MCFKTKSIHGNNIIAIFTENFVFFLFGKLISLKIQVYVQYVADRLFNLLYQHATGCLQNQSCTL